MNTGDSNNKNNTSNGINSNKKNNTNNINIKVEGVPNPITTDKNEVPTDTPYYDMTNRSFSKQTD